MKKEKHIYDDYFWYDFVHVIANWHIRHSYRRMIYSGLENIPDDGVIIFAPNHICALMDPLTILAMDNKKKVFVARADIFKRPFLSRLLTFMKMIPINRKRDGIRSVIKAEESIDQAIEVLKNDTPFIIMPEGTHQGLHSLLPIGKGVARVAVGAHYELMGRKKVYLVPVGLDYGDLFRFRTTLLAQFAKPIDIGQYIESMGTASTHNIMQGIRETLSERIKEKIVYIDTDEEYEGTWECAKMLSGHISKNKLKDRFEANRAAVARIKALPEERRRPLLDEAVGLAAERRRCKVSINSTYGKSPLGRALLSTLMVLVNLPFGTTCAVASLPVWLTSALLTRNLKDKLFKNSFRCAVNVVLWTLLFVVESILLFCLAPLNVAIIGSLLILMAPGWTYDYLETLRIFTSDWRYLFNGTLRNKVRAFNEILKNL